jgi:electron transport complex protein RnfG
MTAKDIIKVTINLVVIYVAGGLLLAGVYAWTSPIIFQKDKEFKEKARQKMMPLHLIVNAPADAQAQIKELLPEAEATATEGQLDAEVDMYDKELAALEKKLKKAGATYIEEVSDYATELAGEWEPHEKEAEYFKVTKDGEKVGYLVETYGKGYSSFPQSLVVVDNDLVVQKINVLAHSETPGLGDEIEVPSFKDQYRGKDLDHLVVIKGETEDKIQAITGATISTRAVTDSVRDAVELIKKISAGGEEQPMMEEGEGDAGH